MRAGNISLPLFTPPLNMTLQGAALWILQKYSTEYILVPQKE